VDKRGGQKTEPKSIHRVLWLLYRLVNTQILRKNMLKFGRTFDIMT